MAQPTEESLAAEPEPLTADRVLFELLRVRAKQAEMLAAARAPSRPNSTAPTGEPAAQPPGFSWGTDLSKKDPARPSAQRPQG